MKHVRPFVGIMAALAAVLGSAPLGPSAAQAVPAGSPTGWNVPATGSPAILVYRFETFARNGAVADLSGGDNNAAVRASGGGTVRPSLRGAGYAAVFPAPCRPAGRICPRAVLETAHRPALNPGTGPIRYGASVLLPAGNTSAGENVIQKGFHDSASQWKLQIDGSAGAPSCVVASRGRGYLARSAVRVADGRWHRVECRRAGRTLTVAVDGQITGRTSVPLSLSIANTSPVRVGGNGPSQDNDQFFGALDDVFAVVG